MAPTNVFSKFRPNHRRTGSNPTSPDASSYNQQPFSSHLPPPPPNLPPPPPLNDDAARPSTSPASSSVPVLPPIPRVTSIYETLPPLDVTKYEPAQDASDAPQRGRLWGELPRVDDARREQPYTGDAWRDDARRTHGDAANGAVKRHVPKQAFAETVRELMKKENPLPPAPLRSRGQGPPAVGSSAPGLQPSNAVYVDSGRPPYSKLQSSPAVMAAERRPAASRFGGSSENLPVPKSKGRLTLLNPMSLWSRRRSGQSIDPLSNESLSGYRGPYVPAMTLPDDYDPRIRGKGVHDFSAPRPRRIITSDSSGAPTSVSGQTSVNSSERPPSSGDYFGERRNSGERSPSKTQQERFEGGHKLQISAAAARAQQLATNDFTAQATVPPPTREPPPVPGARKPSLAARRSVTAPADIPVNLNKELPPLSPVQEATPPPDQNIHKKASTKSIPRASSRTLSGAEWQPAGLPAHMSSKASRFSFQIAGADSAEEKLLEERHKQKAAAKASTAPDGLQDDEDYFDEDAMYDPEGMDDFDGFEERIPGVNSDGDDLGYGYGYGAMMSPAMQAFDFSPMNMTTLAMGSPMFMQPGVQTPLDAQGNRIGYALSADAPEDTNIKTQVEPPKPTPLQQSQTLQGLGLVGVDQSLELQEAQDKPRASSITDANGAHDRAATLDDYAEAGDDLYFDDGLIDDPGNLADEDKFDESLLDDPSGPFFDRPAPKVRFSDPDLDNIDGNIANGGAIGLAPKPSVSGVSRHPSDVMGQKGYIAPSDFETLNAYHGALADAANKAAESGRFNRKESVDLTNIPSSASPDPAHSDTGSSGPSLVPDDGRFSQATSTFSPTGFGGGIGYLPDDDYYTSDFDDTLDNDPIIAAANAEALANDDEGEYGREFGFWANADPKSDAIFSNGGYFGPREDVLGRSTSGRNAMREPNLTPITERSEISNRNSFISFSGTFGGYSNSGAIPSPGLAQLARMSPYGFPDEDPDMSLEKLMKLRGKAFGSSASLASGGSSPRNQSPVQFLHTPSAMGGPGLNTWDEGPSGLVEDSDDVLRGTGGESGGNDDREAPTDTNVNASGFNEDEEEDYTGGYAGDTNDYSPSDYGGDDELGSGSPTITASSHPAAFTHPEATEMIPPLPEPHKKSLSLTISEGTAGTASTAIISMATQTPMSSTHPAPTGSLAPLMSPLSPVSPFALPSSTSPFPPISLTTSTTTAMQPPNPPNPANPSSGGGGGGGWARPPSGASFSSPPPEGWRAHSRKGSASADSVTYVREQDEVTGENRWVLERRRTASTGEMELVGREIVEGGRI